MLSLYFSIPSVWDDQGGARRVVVETHGLPVLSPGYLGHKIDGRIKAMVIPPSWTRFPKYTKGIHIHIYIKIDRLVLFIYICIY